MSNVIGLLFAMNY